MIVYISSSSHLSTFTMINISSIHNEQASTDMGDAFEIYLAGRQDRRGPQQWWDDDDDDNDDDDDDDDDDELIDWWIDG